MSYSEPLDEPISPFLESSSLKKRKRKSISSDKKKLHLIEDEKKMRKRGGLIHSKMNVNLLFLPISARIPTFRGKEGLD